MNGTTESKAWWQSRAMIAGYGAIALWFVVFLYQLFAGGAAGITEAAEDAFKFLAAVSPVLGGLAIAGIRGAKIPITAVLMAVVLVGCSTPGTGARTDPQTGTSAVGAQTVGRTQAGATYVIKSEGTVYNIDSDGSPNSEAAVKAIATALLKFDETLSTLTSAFAASADPSERALLLDAIKWVTAAKTEFMKESKGAFGLSVVITNKGNGNGSSTVDTAGATGEVGIPPTTDPGDGE